MNPYLQRIGADNEYARRVSVAGTGLIETYALQNRSEAARDVLARAASQGRYDTARLLVLIKTVQRHPKSAEARELIASLSPLPLLSLAKVIANQNFHPSDGYDAVVLYKAVIGHHGTGTLRRDDRLVFVELLATMRFVRDLEKYVRLLKVGHLDAVQPSLLYANAVNPFTRGDEDGSVQKVKHWLEGVNDVLAREGLEPIGIAPGTEPAIDRIMCAASTFVANGPKVTVIVPTYDPGPRIATAIESLLAQSYRNLEILVMDDASPDESGRLLDVWEGRDPRIRVVHLAQNGGTYKARNIAVTTYASGEYITVHDDDDWSHPRKIELQVRHLEERRDEPANVSFLSRTTEDLHFARINNNAVFTQRNYSSLMIRRSAFDVIGYWDLANRSADAEMYDRIRAWTGRDIPAVGRAPVSFLRVRQSSLTSGEISKGYFDVRRLWYQRVYRAWHEARISSGESLYVGPDDSKVRPFAAPVNMIGSKHDDSLIEVDVLYATDYRFPGGNSSLSCRELETLLDRGYTVGLLQLDSPLLSAKSVLHPDVVKLVEHDNVRIVSLADHVRAGVTIVRHPTVLQYIRRERSAIDTDQLLLIVNHPPFESDLTGAVYDLSDVVSNAIAVFGLAPRIAPESGLIRELLKGLVDPRLLASTDWNGIVRVGHGTVHTAAPDRSLIYGRHSRDHLQKWPARDVIYRVYPVDGSRDVRVLGGADHAAVRLGHPVENWTVYPFGSKSASDFLDELDFWVYFHGDEWFESFGMAIAEAMAAGLVVILPKYMKATFGKGALYCEPDEALALMDKLWSDGEAYAAQSKRALEYAAERFGEKAFIRRIEALLPAAVSHELTA